MINTPRYYWDPVVKDFSTVADMELRRTVEIGEAGLIQTRQRVQGDPIVLAADEIEVEPCAVSLSLKVSLLW